MVEGVSSARHFVGMTIDPDSFNKPVVDYNYNSIAKTDSENNSVSKLIAAMGDAGGFTATKLNVARNILHDMFEELESSEFKKDKCLNWLSFPACLFATGTRSFFVESIKQNKFNVVITTCGTLDHDIARSYESYFHGKFELDDIELSEYGLNRLGNVIVPNSSYGEIIEEKVLPILEQIKADRIKSTGKEGADIWTGFGTAELVWELGDRIGTEDSLIYWAAKNRIPVIIPGITDGSIGAQLFMFRQNNPEFTIDVMADEQLLSDYTWVAEKSNALMVGGGISKHHVIWWNQYRGGLDSAVYITTAPEYDGSLSGARLKEAISWGKMRPEAPNICVEGDASLLLPLLGVDLLS